MSIKTWMQLWTCSNSWQSSDSVNNRTSQQDHLTVWIGRIRRRIIRWKYSTGHLLLGDDEKKWMALFQKKGFKKGTENMVVMEWNKVSEGILPSKCRQGPLKGRWRRTKWLVFFVKLMNTRRLSNRKPMITQRIMPTSSIITSMLLGELDMGLKNSESGYGKQIKSK